jgi:probable F420-dependent oxidoreductase
MSARLGFTFPFDGVPLGEHARLAAWAEQLGYRDGWTGEVDRHDAFVPLAGAASATTDLRLGTGIVSAFTRGPALLAMSAATMAELAPGRFVLGIGSGSDVIVERWNDIPFAKPLSKVRDVTAVLREALAGDKVVAEHDTVEVNGYRLPIPPVLPVPIVLAALRPKMLRLAGEVADGVLLNWLSAGDVPQAAAEVRAGAEAAGHGRDVEVACRVFVCPGDDHAAAETAARRFIAAYQTVPVYWAFQQWLGRGEALRPMYDAWQERRRPDAVAAIPTEVVGDLVLHGDLDACRAGIERYFAAGVDTVILHFLATADRVEARGRQCTSALGALAPGSTATRWDEVVPPGEA